MNFFKCTFSFNELEKIPIWWSQLLKKIPIGDFFTRYLFFLSANVNTHTWRKPNLQTIYVELNVRDEHFGSSHFSREISYLKLGLETFFVDYTLNFRLQNFVNCTLNFQLQNFWRTVHLIFG